MIWFAVKLLKSLVALVCVVSVPLIMNETLHMEHYVLTKCGILIIGGGELDGQRLDDLVHDNDGSDADDYDDDGNDVDENNENDEGENDDENDNESIDFAIENQVPQAHVNLLS